jgi:multiple sugar transport system substrate-binding protein
MRMWTRRPRVISATLATLLGIGLLAGCGSSGPEKPDKKITVWSLENLPARMAVTKKIVHHFEKSSGVQVKVVGVAENQLPQLIMSAAASGNLPDVIGALPLGQLWQMYGNGLLDTHIAGDIVDGLGRKTFNPNALKLASDGSTQLAVPSDAWLQILVYRKDLFAKAGLPVPDSYQAMLEAAAKLDTKGHVGASVATDPGDVFTQQSFESMALANNCQLVDSAGTVHLDSPACRRAFHAYAVLADKHGAAGLQTVDTTRATYFAGRSPMVLWSSFILDELAGLRDDALPSCPKCKKNPGFLSDNSGVVTAMKGPDGKKPAQFGEITSWAVTKTAEKKASRSFVEYMMNKGYQDWIGMSPEGKIPVRSGTADAPEKFEKAWRSDKIGVGPRKPFDQVYSDKLLDQLLDGVTNMKRWGITQGQGALVGATNGELPVPKAIGEMTSGQASPQEAAQRAQEEVSALSKSLH